MANRFAGSYRKVATRPVVRLDGGGQPIYGPRGIARMDRVMKREEAEERNKRTRPERRRKFRFKDSGQ